MQLISLSKHIMMMYTENALYVIFTFTYLECPSNPARYKSSVTATRKCVKYCYPNTYALDTNRSCVSTCPNYYFTNYSLTHV